MRKISIKTRRENIPCEIYENESSKHLYVDLLNTKVEKSIFLGNYNLIIPQNTENQIIIYYFSYSDGAYVYSGTIDMPVDKNKTVEETLISLICSLHNKQCSWTNTIIDPKYTKKKWFGLVYQ